MMYYHVYRLTAFLFFTLGALVTCTALAGSVSAAPVPSPPDIEVFSREGCPHCEAAKQFLHALRREQPDLQIVIYDIWQDAGARQRLQALAAAHGAAAPGVPAFYLRGELLIGYAGPDTTGARLKALLEHPRPALAEQESSTGVCPPETNLPCEQEAGTARAETELVEIPALGVRLTVQQLGFPLFTFVLGLLDGFNPCSMWVLILMLSMLAGLKDRVKMFMIAGAFVAVEGIAYFAFMAAWLNLFLLVGLSRTSEVILGVIACVAGAINLKDFWALGRGISLSIPQSAKPRVYARIRHILQAEHLTVALVSAVILAVFVQVVELLCTSGFPALYTRILTLRQFDRWTYYGYLLLYDIAYMLDDVMVLTIGVITLSQRRLQEKEGRWLKLLSGVIMVGLGAYLLATRH